MFIWWNYNICSIDELIPEAVTVEDNREVEAPLVVVDTFVEL